MLESVKNVIKLTDEAYVHLDQVPELVKLYAQIDCNISDCILEKSNRIAKEIGQYDGRRIRIIETRSAFEKAAGHLLKKKYKPVNDDLVDDVKEFFKRALLAGYNTSEELYKKLRIDNNQNTFEILSNFAQAQRMKNESMRYMGRRLRNSTKETIAPFPTPRVAGRTPR